MGSKLRKQKKGKKGKKKKKKKRRKKTSHGASDEVLSFPEPEVKRLKEMPLYEQWDGLFLPGKKSFWERFHHFRSALSRSWAALVRCCCECDRRGGTTAKEEQD